MFHPMAVAVGRCAHRPESDIYDNMSVTVAYKGGTILTYTLNLFAMKEGFNMTITGESGMLICNYYGYDVKKRGEHEILLLNRENEVQRITFPLIDETQFDKTHGGGDIRLREMMFGDTKMDDPLGQSADSFAGVVSAMIGIGANESIRSGKVYDLATAIDTLR